MANRRVITVRSAIALGIGSMVGAGIFALLGEAAALAGSAVWISFLTAGVIGPGHGLLVCANGHAFPVSRRHCRISRTGLRSRSFSGACSILFYIAQLIGMSMIALAFGKYSTKLVGPCRPPRPL